MRGMAVPLQQPLSAEEFLEMERKSPTKHQFIDGRVFAMAGASRAHTLITTRLASELDRALRGKDCNTASNDLRVGIPGSQSYVYPDILIYCGEGEWLDDQFDTLLNPLVVIEVLSPSTEAFDRGKKFQQYKLIPSIRHFIFVSQDTMSIDAFERLEDGNWRIETLAAPAEELKLLDASIPLSIIYERVL